MKRVVTTFLLVGLIFVNYAHAGKPKGEKYSSAEGRISITFPGPYEIEENATDYGKTVKASATIGDEVYFSAYTLHDIPLDGADDYAQISLDAFNGQLNGEIVSQSDWTIKKTRGIRATINLAGDDAKIQYRVVIRGSIQYQLVAIASNETWNQSRADAFFNSCKLK